MSKKIGPLLDSYVTPSLTQMMYSWSKWNKGQYGIVKEELEEWSCQVCGEIQTNIMPSWMIPFDDSRREFIRVCSFCKYQSLLRKKMYAPDLISIKERIVREIVSVEILISKLHKLI